MTLKLLFTHPFKIYFFSFLLTLQFVSFDLNAQCSGIAGNDDNTLNICDIPNVSSKTIDLNLRLGTHTAGGFWRDDNRSGGLDRTTGILNAQLIKKSGIYNYTYTVSDGFGCSDTAVVTVTIGGYTGVPAPNTSICNTKSAYNLFEAFNGDFLAPQSGGTWVGNTSTAGLSNNVLNATFLNYDRTYEYTYSIPAIGSCPAPPDVKIFVTIYRSPEPGFSSDLKLCSNVLSTYTNFDLNDQLSGEDAGGVWTETVTDELNNADDSDHTIDIQNIYNTRGPGNYRFTYTVFSDNNVCFDQSSNVDITIEKLLDYTGASMTLNAPVCENEVATTAFSGTIQNVVSIPDGVYSVTYNISGIGSSITKTSSFSNNVLTFPIDRSNFLAAGDYTVTVTNIVSATTLNICSNIIPLISGVIKINPIPKINTATLRIDPVCQNDVATVAFSGTSNLADGSYAILYNLSAPNAATAIPVVMNVVGGISSFQISSSLLAKYGQTRITITKITNVTTGCTNSSTLNKDFIVNPLPDVSNLFLVINDVCKGESATVNLSGFGSLTDITIDYSISGANSVSTQSGALTAIGGRTSFTIPATDIPNAGLNTFTITKVTNVLTGCFISTLIPKDFTVNPIPATPLAIDQQFCTADSPTVASLQPTGTPYRWYDSALSTVALSSTTPLQSQNYFVKEVNPLTKCESLLKMIAVQINSTPQINSATLGTDPICQGYNASVNFSGTSNLADGNYYILYNLTGANNASSKAATLTITGGVGSFPIMASLIQNAGNTTLSITSITNSATLCSNSVTLTKAFVVNAVPDITNMVVTVNDSCLGQDVNVAISGLGPLTTISVNYALNGANTIGSQTVNLVLNGGRTNFKISASLLANPGTTILEISNLSNSANGCPAVFASPLSKSFTLNTIPVTPVVMDQKFCKTDLKTVASLSPNGNQYKWYSSLTASSPLANTALLVSGIYYVKAINGATGCESSAAAVNVLVSSVPAPTLKANGNEFCGIDKPTIISLTNNTNFTGNLTWFDAVTNGKQFDNNELLLEGVTYYGFNADANTNCFSDPLITTVVLTGCTVTPDNFFIPDGFSPNGDGINETFQIKDIEFLFPNYTIEIYNRYGNLMFKGNINNPDWDGKNSNSNFINGDAPSGVYFYVIQYNKDNLPPKQGQLYLNR